MLSKHFAQVDRVVLRNREGGIAFRGRRRQPRRYINDRPKFFVESYVNRCLKRFEAASTDRSRVACASPAARMPKLVSVNLTCPLIFRATLPSRSIGSSTAKSYVRLEPTSDLS